MPLPVPPTIGRVRFAATKALWFWAQLLPGCWILFSHPDWTLVTWSLALTGLTFCLGHTVGLHRGIIHRSYRCSPLLRGCFAWLFVLTGLGGPLTWARLHAERDHWQNEADCPPYFAYRHGLLRDCWWNLHCRFVAADERALTHLPPDVLSDPWLRFLEATWPLHVLALALLCGWLGGPPAIALCVCLRGAIGILGHWFVGYVAHAWGHGPYAVTGAVESGTNHWLLGVCSFGEGFHNNHHAFPTSARIGLRWWQLDAGWWAICLLRRLGLVHDVRLGPGTAAPRGIRAREDEVLPHAAGPDAQR